ncbi:peptidase S8/S53 domain-containing protein [Schizophyllum commune]
MRAFALVLVAAAIAVSAKSTAAILDRDFAVKETVQPPPIWVKHSTPNPDHVIKLRIALPQPNFDVLEKLLYDVSDPYHENYGLHLSKEEVETLVAPEEDSVSAVTEWLATHGLEEEHLERSPAGDWVTIRVPVQLAEEMLDTKYHVYKHVSADEYIVRTTSYSLPAHLHDHVELVQPTTVFGSLKAFRSTIVLPDDEMTFTRDAEGNTLLATAATNCTATITVDCIKQYYNATGYEADPTLNNSIGITGYLEEFANYDDLQLFYADQLPEALNSSFDYISVNGGKNNQSSDAAGGEADLDVQFAFGISHPIQNKTFWSTAGKPPFKPDLGTPTNTNEPYTEWLDFVLSQDDIPLVISTSYGDDEQTVPEPFARRVCRGFAQLGARGVSLLFSSGDGGVGDGEYDPAQSQCISNDGKNTTKFLPGFPASCPYVTAVGGTTLTKDNEEVAVSRFFSGAGFSEYFKRPAYQHDTVKEYLAALPNGTYEGLFNRHGRAFPDVSAFGDRFRVFWGGEPVLIGGTSASSPAFAGIVALLNGARLSAGLPPLGFLNPFFYSKGAAGFNDITVGNSTGCGTIGFNATKGWDAVTGLGTPNFGVLKDLVLADNTDC